jgi:hypothetical protein
MRIEAGGNQEPTKSTEKDHQGLIVSSLNKRSQHEEFPLQRNRSLFFPGQSPEVDINEIETRQKRLREFLPNQPQSH